VTRHGDGHARLARALAAAAAVACLTAGVAQADGDPASDTLVGQSVFFPYTVPARTAEAALSRAVDAVYARGERVKVAVIYNTFDLGSVGSLYGQPDEYAHFLGIELGLWYVGPLLVVMPAGFGIYDGGRSTSAEASVLRSLRVDASTVDDLVNSATGAVQKLAAAHALTSTDVRPPLVTPRPAVAKRGTQATLRFEVFDDSGRTKETVRVYENRLLLATLGSPLRFAIGTRTVSVHWQVPAKLASRKLRYCVVAADPAGNRNVPACAPFIRVT